MGIPHTKNDLVVTWKEIKEAKHEVLCHTRALSKVFQIGEAHGEANQDRVRDALHEDRTILPDLVLTQKNQKPLCKETKLPKTRPICQASTTFNMRASGHLCTILGGAIAADETCESISTEDTIAKVD